VYVSLNGYRNDDFTSYLYVSEDQGKTWNRIGKNLPMEPINVVREDPTNEHLLFVGTDHGVYASLDRGTTFFSVGKDLPAVAVHDLLIHQKTGDLVLGTHGRSLYVGNIKYLQQLSAELLQSELVAYPLEKQRFNSRWGSRRNDWSEWRAPKMVLPIYLPIDGQFGISIKTDKGTVVKNWTENLSKGLQFISYDISIDEKQTELYEQQLNAELEKNAEKVVLKKAPNGVTYLRKGIYQVTYNLGKLSQTTSLVVE
jgi:ligand-binding sensor domain-containing protein